MVKIKTKPDIIFSNNIDNIIVVFRNEDNLNFIKLRTIDNDMII